MSPAFNIKFKCIGSSLHLSLTLSTGKRPTVPEVLSYTLVLLSLQFPLLGKEFFENDEDHLIWC